MLRKDSLIQKEIAKNKTPLKICIIGGAGQISYSLVPMIAAGEVFGRSTPVKINIQDIPQKMEYMRGTVMELEDCRYPLLEEIKYGTDAKELLDDIDWAIILASKPLGMGEARSALIKKNAELMLNYGTALNAVAKPTAKVVMISNPVNTMSYVLSKIVSKIPKTSITALTMIDHNRTLSQIAKYTGSDPDFVRNVICWGNHSKTMYPDVTYATIAGKPVLSKIKDPNFLNKEFLEIIRNRAYEIQKARNQTAGFSTAAALRDHIKALYLGTPEGEWLSMGVYTDGNVYGIEKDLYCSLPVMCENEMYEIVEGFKWDAFAKSEIEKSINELKEEREEADQAMKALNIKS